MRYFGTIDFEKKGSKQFWCIETEPHVAVRIKRIFKKISINSGTKITLADSLEMRDEILWFMERYPMKCSSENHAILISGRIAYRKQRDDCETAANALSKEHAEVKRGALDLALPLRHYQNPALELLERKGKYLLADEVGLGKTAMGLAGATLEGALPTLVVCQPHLINQWKQQIEKFIPSAQVYIFQTRQLPTRAEIEGIDIFITPYSRIIYWLESDNLANLGWTDGFFKYVIFDEVQELRRKESKKYEVSTILALKAHRALGLSATPIYNYGNEIFNILNLLSPDSLGEESEFRREWTNPFSGHVTDPAALGSYLREQHLLLRRTRKDIGRELPPVVKEIIDISYDEAAMHKALEESRELAERALLGEAGAGQELIAVLRRKTGILKAVEVAKYVRTLLESGEKVLLVGWHRAVYEIWLSQLSEFKPVMYTGTESPQKKNESREAFVNGDSQLLILSLMSGAGLDGLQEVCDIVVFGELDWSPQVHHQVIGRLARDGQTNHVLAFFCVADGGVDPIMLSVLGLKKSQSDAIILNPGEGESFVAQEETSDSRAKMIAEKVISVQGGETALKEVREKAQEKERLAELNKKQKPESAITIEKASNKKEKEERTKPESSPPQAPLSGKQEASKKPDGEPTKQDLAANNAANEQKNKKVSEVKSKDTSNNRSKTALDDDQFKKANGEIRKINMEIALDAKNKRKKSIDKSSKEIKNT